MLGSGMCSLFVKVTAVSTPGTLPARVQVSQQNRGLRFSGSPQVTIIGSGNWGCAIARIVGQNTATNITFATEVRMWTHEEIVEVDGKKQKLSDVATAADFHLCLCVLILASLYSKRRLAHLVHFLTVTICLSASVAISERESV